MHARLIAALLSLATFCLILVGGVVHSTGSSLACPDYPLCNGQVFPKMVDGVFYEHGHRLLAAGVALLTLGFLVAVWRQERAKRLYGVLGLALVLFQAMLGAITVLQRLPPSVSTAHLGTSMAFFAWTLGANLLVNRSRQAHAALPMPKRRLLFGACIAVYSQLLLGAVVRHRGASMSCGYDVVLCLGRLLPTEGLQWLQTAHRLLGVVVMGLVLAATLPLIKQARAQGRRGLRQLGVAAHGLVCLQVLMGVLVVKHSVQIHVVTTHLALGALLWGTMVVLYLSSGAQGASATVRSNASPDAALGARSHEPSGAC